MESPGPLSPLLHDISHYHPPTPLNANLYPVSTVWPFPPALSNLHPLPRSNRPSQHRSPLVPRPLEPAGACICTPSVFSTGLFPRSKGLSEVQQYCPTVTNSTILTRYLGLGYRGVVLGAICSDERGEKRPVLQKPSTSFSRFFSFQCLRHTVYSPSFSSVNGFHVISFTPVGVRAWCGLFPR